jgi:hypothetical protein
VAVIASKSTIDLGLKPNRLAAVLPDGMPLFQCPCGEVHTREDLRVLGSFFVHSERIVLTRCSSCKVVLCLDYDRVVYERRRASSSLPS